MKPPVLSTDIAGLLRFYSWTDKRKANELVFRARPASSDEWPADTAKFMVETAMADGQNVRIENEKGEIVFMARNGLVTFPRTVDEQKRFWEECGK
jgi:hypothetical protein